MLQSEPLAESAESIVNWAEDAPRGGKAVLSRILKENATVPLFFAQTLISSLRDVGYNHTTSALCEHVDNALQAGATEIRVFFRQSGKKGEYKIDAAVYDNGQGMEPHVLKVATAFGGSMTFNNRTGIGRFGMGMKTAALSMSPVMELYSWQEPGAFYGITLDIDAVGRDRSNQVNVPDPTLREILPDEILSLFTRPMAWPRDASEQDLLGNVEVDAREWLGRHGTIVYMPECDRLSSAKAQTLGDHAVGEMARVYRRAIGKGLRLYVNNRRVEAFDPTYSMADARHTQMLEPAIPNCSRLVVSKTIPIRVNEAQTSSAVPITVKIFQLPIEAWSDLPRKVQKNDLRIFDGLTVTILRNDRELFAGPLPKLTSRHSVTHWYRVQIDFPGALDEAFGVAANKQGVRMKDYVLDAIKGAIGDEITRMNDEVRRFQAEKSRKITPGKASIGEQRATDVDNFHTKPLDGDLTDVERAQLDANLRGLAVTLRREGETAEQAFDRVKSSRYLIATKHDAYWPFYHVEHKFGRVILTINTAHAFYDRLYKPLQDLAAKAGAGADPDEAPDGEPQQTDDGPNVALDLMLLSLARAQAVLGARDDETQQVFDQLRREWSETYRIQLGA